jgi:hypothetical protein
VPHGKGIVAPSYKSRGILCVPNEGRPGGSQRRAHDLRSGSDLRCGISRNSDSTAARQPDGKNVWRTHARRTKKCDGSIRRDADAEQNDDGGRWRRHSSGRSRISHRGLPRLPSFYPLPTANESNASFNDTSLDQILHALPRPSRLDYKYLPVDVSSCRMASTASTSSTHSGAGGAALPTSAAGGGMEELLPLVLQLTNSEQVRQLKATVIQSFIDSFVLPVLPA